MGVPMDARNSAGEWNEVGITETRAIRTPSHRPSGFWKKGCRRARARTATTAATPIVLRTAAHRAPSAGNAVSRDPGSEGSNEKAAAYRAATKPTRRVRPPRPMAARAALDDAGP